MSRSPHRFRGDAAECWRAILFGEILRALDEPVIVRADATITLPRTGHWESGLGRVRPSLDDALGATAFAVAWRWACAERDRLAWPGLPLIAAKAVDHAITAGTIPGMARTAGGIEVSADASARGWQLSLPGESAVIGVSLTGTRDWREIDRVADVLSAWFDAPWSLVGHLRAQ